MNESLRVYLEGTVLILVQFIFKFEVIKSRFLFFEDVEYEYSILGPVSKRTFVKWCFLEKEKDFPTHFYHPYSFSLLGGGIVRSSRGTRYMLPRE